MRKLNLPYIYNTEHFLKLKMAFLFLPLICVAAFAQPTVSTAQLYKEYNENSVRFESNYDGKRFYIAGKIFAIGPEPETLFSSSNHYIVKLTIPGSGMLIDKKVNVIYPMTETSRKMIYGMEENQDVTILVRGTTTYARVNAVLPTDTAKKKKDDGPDTLTLIIMFVIALIMITTGLVMYKKEKALKK